MKKRILIFVLMFCFSILCSCNQNPVMTDDNKNEATIDAEVEEKTVHIEQILSRYIEGVNILGDSACVKIIGPVTQDGKFYTIFVDTVPANGWGIKDEIRFYMPSSDYVKKSFSATFSKDYSMQSLRQFIALTIFAIEPNITYETAEDEMNNLIANYDNKSPSNLYIGSEYYVYVAPANIVTGYTVEVVHISESNESIDKSKYIELDHGAMASELNKGVACFITATPYEIIVNYPYADIKAEDSQNNKYYISGVYNDVLQNVQIDNQYKFYVALSGKIIENEIYCGLRFFE